MAFSWTEQAEGRVLAASSGGYTLKVFETMLGHAIYLVQLEGRLICAGDVPSVAEAKAEAERVARG
jgi:hypothetical protein